MKTRFAVMGTLLLAVFARSGDAEAALCYLGDVGKPMTWASMPITYQINAEKVPAADKAGFLTAVKAAFAEWEKIPCTSIKFTDGGETTSADPSGSNTILIHFSDVATGSAYDAQTNSGPPDPQKITGALIKLNLNITGGFGYTVGAKAKMFDVQTAVKNLLAPALGFCGELNTGGKTCKVPADEWKLEYVNHVISDLLKEGAQATYFEAGTGCTQPSQPPACASTTPPTGDASVPSGDGSVSPGQEGGITPTPDGGGTISGDGPSPGFEGSIILPPPEEDNGCCRVSHARQPGGLVVLGLLGLGLLLALRRRRR